MLNIERLAEKIFEKAKEEYALSKSLYKDNKLDDFEISCDINFYKNNKNLAYHDTLYLKHYVEENNFEKFLESLSFCSLFVSHKAEKELKDIRNSDFAMFKLTSHLQIVKNSVKLEKLKSVLLEIELKLFQLRDELHPIYFKKFPWYSMSAVAGIIFEDPEAEEISFYIQDFKYPSLHPKEPYFFFNLGISLRQFKRLCGEKTLKASPIKEVFASLDVSVEHIFNKG